VRLSGRRVLRPDGSLGPGTVVIDGARITAVEDAPAGSGPDVTLAPGLIDVQVNGAAARDAWSATADGLDELGAWLARRGTTGWCPTLTSRPLDAYATWLSSHDRPATGEIGLHLEGPFLSRPGAHTPAALRPEVDRAWLAGLPARVRIVTLAPELPGALEAITELTARGVVVALGHTDATYDDALRAAEAGARLVTHVFNAMTPLGHRQPGLPGAALTLDALTPAVIGDGVHVHPAILGLVLRTGTAVLVSDSVAWERGGLVTDGGAARLADGTLAGSMITLAGAVKIAVEQAGVALGTALTAATATPAALLGCADRGRLVAGARADVVELDGGLQPCRVWVGGNLLGPG
jgi:N-acetylglucosamine-6-phosphate deacetylase